MVIFKYNSLSTSPSSPILSRHLSLVGFVQLRAVSKLPYFSESQSSLFINFYNTFCFKSNFHFVQHNISTFELQILFLRVFERSNTKLNSLDFYLILNLQSNVVLMNVGTDVFLVFCFRVLKFSTVSSNCPVNLYI